ncbi:MAG: aminotransferase class IV, partial [Terriglobales bacterium]
MNTALANWNGEQMPLQDVRVSVLDRAFLFGDAVYEVLRIYSGRLFRIDDHLERMSKSRESLRINGVETAVLRERVQQTTANSGVTEGLAYIQVTRGEAPRTHRYPDNAVPNVLIYADNFDDPYKDIRDCGVSAVSHPDIRWGRNDIKATSLAANCMAAQYAYERGCAEVLFIDAKGIVTEGSHTSIFAVRNGMLVSAPASQNILPGITKKLILELAKSAGIFLTEGRVSQNDLKDIDELFLSGTPE